MEPGNLAARSKGGGCPDTSYLLRSSLPPNQINPVLFSAGNHLCPVEEKESENTENDMYDNDKDETLSYEECLWISEALGDVKQEEWALRAEGEINKLGLETFEEANNADADACTCLVCLQPYEENDLVRKLPYGHNFHICCADQWLMRANACPCCRTPIAEE